MVGLGQPLIEKLNKSPLLISMWRALYQQILEMFLALGKLLILFLSE
jgi:hypothetical protein